MPRPAAANLKPSASGFGLERRGKEAERSFRREPETEWSGFRPDEAAATYWRLAIPPRKGVKANVEKEAHEDSANFIFRGNHSDSSHHKSVLTARMAPKRSTNYLTDTMG